MQIVFITYIPRSGSTLLLSKLYPYEEICSLTENNAVNKILHSGVVSKKKIDYFFEYTNRHSDWFFSAEEKKHLYQIKNKYDFLFQILLLQQNKQNPKAKVILYKNSGMGFFLSTLPQKYVEQYEIRVIALVRDIRAVYYSRVQAYKTYHLFNKNPLIVINEANAFLCEVENLKKHIPLLVIKYEDFILHENKKIQQMLFFISKSIDFIFTSKSNFYKKIKFPHNQLHQNIQKEVMLEKIDEWKTCENIEAIYLLRHYGYRYLMSFGYETKKNKTNRVKIKRYVWYKLRLFLKIDNY